MRKLVFISLLGFFLLSSNAYAQDAIGYDSAIVPQDIVFSYTAPLL